jgi:hypothetical protein
LRGARLVKPVKKHEKKLFHVLLPIIVYLLYKLPYAGIALQVQRVDWIPILSAVAPLAIKFCTIIALISHYGKKRCDSLELTVKCVNENINWGILHCSNYYADFYQ